VSLTLPPFWATLEEEGQAMPFTTAGMMCFF
jgi:hypothetical protein